MELKTQINHSVNEKNANFRLYAGEFVDNHIYESVFSINDQGLAIERVQDYTLDNYLLSYLERTERLVYRLARSQAKVSFPQDRIELDLSEMVLLLDALQSSNNAVLESLNLPAEQLQLAQDFLAVDKILQSAIIDPQNNLIYLSIYLLAGERCFEFQAENIDAQNVTLKNAKIRLRALDAEGVSELSSQFIQKMRALGNYRSPQLKMLPLPELKWKVPPPEPEDPDSFPPPVSKETYFTVTATDFEIGIFDEYYALNQLLEEYRHSEKPFNLQKIARNEPNSRLREQITALIGKYPLATRNLPFLDTLIHSLTKAESIRNFVEKHAVEYLLSFDQFSAARNSFKTFISAPSLSFDFSKFEQISSPENFVYETVLKQTLALSFLYSMNSQKKGR
jgi:hypothetical protein